MIASLESNLDYKESLFWQDDWKPISQTDEDSWLQQVLHPNDFSLFQDNAHDIHDHKSAELDLKMEDEFDKKPIEDKDNSSKLNASNLKDLVSKDSQIINFEEQKEIFAEPTYLPLNNLEMNQKIHELEGYSQAEIGASIAKKTPLSLDSLKRIARAGKHYDPSKFKRFGRIEDRGKHCI